MLYILQFSELLFYVYDTTGFTSLKAMLIENICAYLSHLHMLITDYNDEFSSTIHKKVPRLFNFWLRIVSYFSLTGMM